MREWRAAGRRHSSAAGNGLPEVDERRREAEEAIGRGCGPRSSAPVSGLLADWAPTRRRADRSARPGCQVSIFISARARAPEISWPAGRPERRRWIGGAKSCSNINYTAPEVLRRQRANKWPPTGLSGGGGGGSLWFTFASLPLCLFGSGGSERPRRAQSIIGPTRRAIHHNARAG